MRLATSFVPLFKVKPTASRWHFSETELAAAAQLVLTVEGIVNPIVIRREISEAHHCEAYRVLDGNFEYYAVALAHQLDRQRCTSIEGFIVEPCDEAVIQKQIALFRRSTALTSLLPDWRYQPVRELLIESAASSGRLTGQLIQLFNQSSAEQLLQRIKQIGLTGRNAEKVVEAIEQERQRQPFHSLKEVVNRIKGLSYEKMIDLVEAES